MYIHMHLSGFSTTPSKCREESSSTKGKIPFYSYDNILYHSLRPPPPSTSPSTYPILPPQFPTTLHITLYISNTPTSLPHHPPHHPPHIQYFHITSPPPSTSSYLITHLHSILNFSPVPPLRD